MTFKKTILLTGTLFLYNACSTKEIPVSEGGYYYENIYFGVDLTDTFKKGIRDGCMTAKGTYTKSHWFFNRKKEYYNGWFLGRNKCRNLLKIDENGDLIL